ncbi:MAG TPA: peptidyl-prolyl cis-trans isomerase, partial [Candidatus Tectomicrobia bacterium]|nr:peptidyl-prolyl cis-trans isomerase [Candidatus Tectomicrobia bacterium]
MIRFMRRYPKTLQVSLFVVILAFIVTSFVVGSSNSDNLRADTVAVVNGESIPRERYARRYQSVLEFYGQLNQGRLSPEMAEQLGLGRRVIEDLVTEALVVQRAEAEGLALTDEEFNAAVHRIPDFQEAGRFSLDRYRRFLQARGVDGERDLRRFLTMQKVHRLVTEGARVTDAEVEQAWAARHEQVRVAWALVDTAALAAEATASDEEVAAYLKDHPDEFRQPERRKVQYVTLVPKEFSKPVGDAAVERYYREHPGEFETPRQVKARHLLVRVPETGGSEAEDRAKARVADAIRRIRGGEDFAKVAREVSEDPGTKESGGDLGWVSQGDLVPQFEEAMLKLDKGAVTLEPVRTPFGFHAIKVEDVRPGGRKPLKEVAPSIRDRLAAEAAEAAARARADEVRPQLQAAKDFMAEARRLGLSPVETTMSRVDRGIMPGGADALEEAAFALAPGGVSTPVKTPAGWVIVKSIESLPAGVPPLAEIRDRVVAAVKRRKAETVGLERAKQIVAEVKGGAELAAAAKKAGARAGDTPHFSRARPAERIPGDAQLAALQTPVNEVSDPVKTPQGYWVLKVLERVPADASGLATERDRLRQELLAQKRSQVWERWVADARAGASIQISDRLGRAG